MAWAGYHHTMYSYRHAFHAGNHADVLKHITLLATLRHLMRKPTGLLLVDTHAGAGLYRLDSEATRKAAEAQDGILKLRAALASRSEPLPEALKDYLDLLAELNPQGGLRQYPGSPFLMHRLLRHEARDRLKLFEMHPTDVQALAAHVAQLQAGRTVQVTREDGFAGLRSLLPPPPGPSGSRRAMVLIDPSYEIKTDYAKVQEAVEDALRRFATGTYVVWYPIIPRPEAHSLPKRLRTLAQQTGKAWLHAHLAIGRSSEHEGGLSASGMVVINPPHTLAGQLREALAVVGPILARGAGQGWGVEHGG